MKDFLKRSNPFTVFFAFALAIHFCLPLNWGDDKVFSSQAVLSLSEFLNGSSRILTDTMTWVFNRYHILWRLTNPLVLTLLSRSMSRLISLTDKKLQYILCLCLLFPTMVVVDAGFIATTVNYLWPVTFGFCSLLIFQNIAAEKKISGPVFLAGIPMLVYAINMEQMSAVLSCTFLIGCTYLFIHKKRFHIYPILQLAISLFGVLYAYFGNTSQENSRMIRETARYFPDFSRLGIFNKIELGFSSTMFCLTAELRFAFIAFLAFSIFLAVMVFRKNAGFIAKLSALIPLIFSFVCAVINTIKPFVGLKHFRMSKAEYLFSPLFDIISFFLLICILYTISQLLSGRLLILKAYTILAAGLSSRILMGFSPTVWASGYRTFCIMFISFIIVTFLILNTERTASVANR